MYKDKLTNKQKKSSSRSRSKDTQKVKVKKVGQKKSSSRSRSKDTQKVKVKKVNIKPLQKIDESLDDDFNFKSFKKLSTDAIYEISKVPGILIKKAAFKDTSGVEMTTIEPLNYEAFLTCTKILDTDPYIQITPSLILDAPLRKYQFNVHSHYSSLTSTFLNAHPADEIPEVFNALGPNPTNLFIQFRSALAASLHELLRFQGNDNPVKFNNIPHGTVLGEMLIIYGGGGHQMLLGPIAYIR